MRIYQNEITSTFLGDRLTNKFYIAEFYTVKELQAEITMINNIIS